MRESRVISRFSSTLWFVPAMMFLASAFMAEAAAAQSGNLVLWNTLGSQDEVENSAVGPDGLLEGGSFMPGVFGNAYVATYDEDRLVSFPTVPLPYPAGAIEFWAKLIDFPAGTCAGGRYPEFVVAKAKDYSILGFSGNDGHGGGGFTATIHGLNTATGGWRCWTYAEILGPDQVEDWHHYAVVWDVSGIPDAGNHEIAIYLDGQLNSGRWGPTNPTEIGRGMDLLGNHGTAGSAAIDNIKVWNYAKTDFSDRFVEDPRGYSFSEFAVGVTSLKFGREDANSDFVNLGGSFVLGQDSDGIDPLTEEVTVTIGAYTLAIPPGSFVWKGNKYEYRDTVDTAKIAIRLRLLEEKGPYAYALKVRMKKIDLAGSANPIDIGLAIGNDWGEVEKYLKGVLKSKE